MALLADPGTPLARKKELTMLELLLCSMLTILPDYLFRRYAQGKRLGKEITFYSVWFELRWGITGCLILTVGLITVIFYNHPSTQNVTLFFRTVPIVPEINGRVAEVYVGVSSPISKGAPIFRLDSSKQEAAAESARRKIAETDAEMLVARADVLKTEGQIQEAKSAHQQTLDELETKRELQRRNAGNVAFRDIEKLEVTLEGRKGAIAAATAAKQQAEERIATPSAGSEGECRSGAGAGRSGIAEDRRPCRRRRARGAVCAAARRYSQSDDASGWCLDPVGCRSARSARRLCDRSKRRS